MPTKETLGRHHAHWTNHLVVAFQMAGLIDGAGAGVVRFLFRRQESPSKCLADWYSIVTVSLPSEVHDPRRAV